MLYALARLDDAEAAYNVICKCSCCGYCNLFVLAIIAVCVFIWLVCGYSCHMHCLDRAPKMCPVPSDQCTFIPTLFHELDFLSNFMPLTYAVLCVAYDFFCCIVCIFAICI